MQRLMFADFNELIKRQESLTKGKKEVHDIRIEKKLYH
jgi:hypothetical protein